MSYIFELLQTSLIIYFSMIFIINKSKFTFVIIYPLSIIFACTLLIGSSYCKLILFLIYLIIYFLLPLFFLKFKFKIAIYLSLFSTLFVSTLNSVILMFLYCILGPTINTLPSAIVSSIILLILMFILLIYKKLIYLIKKLFSISSTTNIFIIIFLGLFFIMLLFEDIMLLLLPNRKLVFIVSFISIILLAACSVAIAYLIISNYKKIYYQKTNETLNKYIQKQIKHYENTIRVYDNLRTFKHDYNNLKIGLTTLLKENKTEEAIKYLNDFNNITGNDTVIKTGNTVVDAIISDKSLDLKRNNINISFTGIVPYDALNISDLCIAFGNALDNAIEACSKMQPESAKNISVEVQQVNNLLMIKMANPVIQKVEINNNTAKMYNVYSILRGILKLFI